MYFSVNGRDNAEKIKYFIKNAEETWNTCYVMLVGSKEEFPARYVDECYWGQHREYISDLYYADLYDAQGVFCSWDSNNDNIFSGKNMSGVEDIVDLYPDIALGRLLCGNQTDVSIVVGKINPQMLISLLGDIIYSKGGLYHVFAILLSKYNSTLFIPLILSYSITVNLIIKF